TDVPLDMNFHNGLGWMLSTLGASTIQGAGPVAHHAGAMIHYRAQLYALPEHRLGVVVLANSGSAGRSVDRVATEALALALEAKAGIRQPKPEKVAPMEKASNFVLTGSIPICDAASSSSRIAIHARPMREFRKRRMKKMERTINPNTKKYHGR
ncbi:MAG: serine hydrolase, partial [Chloroflexi bacterium]|nr:serine hydrolase [Chloroflexota bacterium]